MFSAADMAQIFYTTCASLYPSFINTKGGEPVSWDSLPGAAKERLAIVCKKVVKEIAPSSFPPSINDYSDYDDS